MGVVVDGLMGVVVDGMIDIMVDRLMDRLMEIMVDGMRGFMGLISTMTLIDSLYYVMLVNIVHHLLNWFLLLRLQWSLCYLLMLE